MDARLNGSLAWSIRTLLYVLMEYKIDRNVTEIDWVRLLSVILKDVGKWDFATLLQPPSNSVLTDSSLLQQQRIESRKLAFLAPCHRLSGTILPDRLAFYVQRKHGVSFNPEGGESVALWILLDSKSYQPQQGWPTVQGRWEFQFSNMQRTRGSPLLI